MQKTCINFFAEYPNCNKQTKAHQHHCLSRCSSKQTEIALPIPFLVAYADLRYDT